MRTELRRRGISGGLTLTEVQRDETTRSSIDSDGSVKRLERRVKLELILTEQQVDKAVTVILQHALSSSPDLEGHITVFEVNEALDLIRPESDISRLKNANTDGAKCASKNLLIL